VNEVGHLLRELAPQVLGAVARRHDDFAAAEDAVQEALIAAADQWPRQGVPDNPKGWLFRVAIRRLTDQMRSELARHRREEKVATLLLADAVLTPPADPDFALDRDDTLTLLFMCCHPALTPASAIALTLRAVGGLTTIEIANAFLVPEATMAQRISRAKQSIKSSKIPFSLPDASERAERMRSVLHVLYLIFNEGYTSSVGPELQRTDLASEAIRLARMLHEHAPNEPEAAGLLALMLLTDARRDARTGPAGELIPLDEQDRSRWNRPQIEEGVALLTEALAGGAVGYYQIQAAIAATHDQAATVEDTDWPQIHSLYLLLERMSDNPMVKLNRAIAEGMVHGPERGLALIDSLESDARLAGHYRLDAVRGHLLARSGEIDRAVQHFRKAAERTMSIPERNYLIEKAARLAQRSRSSR
jgi:RNA polymerase sigma factor (sigma-70 family)